jgi:hypothetical protein
LIVDGWKYQLACLIGKSISEIEEMPHEELLMWRFYLSEPRGELRQDYHAASIVQAIYSIAQSFSKNPKKVKMEDCLLKFETEEADMSKKVSKYKAMAEIWSSSFKKKSTTKSDKKSNSVINKRGG